MVGIEGEHLMQERSAGSRQTNDDERRYQFLLVDLWLFLKRFHQKQLLGNVNLFLPGHHPFNKVILEKVSEAQTLYIIT
jgi:hypothetical protein